MVSLNYIITILAVFSAVVLADEVKTGQTENVEEKWWGGRWGFGSGLYGFGYGATIPWFNRWGTIGAYGMFPYYNSLWFKEVDTPAVARRAVSIDAEHIYQRRDDSTVACKNGQGQLDHFVRSDCHKAVQALVSQKSSSANCLSCAVKLVTPKGQLAATGAPVDQLKKVTDNILQSCVTGSSNPTRRSPEETSNSDAHKEQFAIIFQKGDGKNCDK